MTVEIVELEAKYAAGCDAVIASLPAFFGDPGGIEDCARAVRTQRGFVALAGDSVVGFLTLEPAQPSSAEITWMAVHAEHRRAGIGGRLIEAAVVWARGDGVAMLIVMTAGEADEPDRPGDNYTGTRRFYRNQGFVPLKEFLPSGWNQTALLLAMDLRHPLTASVRRPNRT